MLEFTAADDELTPPPLPPVVEMGFIRPSPLTLNAGGGSLGAAVATLLFAPAASPLTAAGSLGGTTISGTKVSTLG